MVRVSGIDRVSVLGAGTMGHGIAQLAAMAGYEVVMRDIEQRFLDSGLERIKWSLGKLVEKGRIKKEEAEKALERIKTTTDLKEASENCDILIEAIPEDLNLKLETFREVDEYAPPHVILASNTSTIPITELASATKRPKQFIGLHFFNPPQLMPLVEIVLGKETSEETVKKAKEFVESLGKQVVIVKKDVPGFIVNRILGPMLDEAAWMVHRGEAKVIEIDSAVRYKLGLPMGPFELLDYSGIDVFYRALNEVKKRDLRNVMLCPLIEEYFKRGWYGMKTGKGFYEYPSKKYERPSIPREAGEKFDPIQVLAPAVNSAAWLLREGVASKEEIDKAVMLGLGFPEGIFRMADKLGIDRIVKVLEEKAAKYGDFYKPDPLLTQMLKEGRTGVKAGKGFYEYGEAEEKRFEEIVVRVEPPLAWIILNRPHRLNALTQKMIEELDRALDALRDNEKVRAVVIRGEGDRAFSVGADITAFAGVTHELMHKLSRRWQEVFNKLERFPKPVIAAIDGYCLGGGMELALACDFRLATERSELGQPEIRLGLIPGAGGTQRMTRLVGIAKAKELILLGDRIPAREAERMDLVNKVYPADEFWNEVRGFALRLAEGPPIALKLAKQAINIAALRGLEEGLAYEAEAFARLAVTEDLVEGVTAFLSKRKPEFKGK